jgi:hypothetical protein
VLRPMAGSPGLDNNCQQEVIGPIRQLPHHAGPKGIRPLELRGVIGSLVCSPPVASLPS